MSDWRVRIPDYHIPNFAESNRGIAESLRHLGDIRRQRQKDLEYKRQNDLSEQRNRQLHDAAMRKAALEESDRNVRAVEDISKDYLETGDLSLARARAEARRFADPKTGQLKGARFFEEDIPGPAPTDILPPREPETERAAARAFADLYGFSKQLRPPDTAAAESAAGLARLRTEDPEAAAGKAVGRMFALRRPEALDEPAAAPEAPERPWPTAPAAAPAGPARRRGVVELPSGERIVLDPDERDRHRLRRAEEQADRALQMAMTPGMDPRESAAWRAEAARLRGALPGASAQHLRGVETMEDKQDFDASQRARYDLTAEQKMEIEERRAAARAARGRDKAITKSQAADDERADVTSFRTDADSWEKGANVDKLTDAYDKFTELGGAVKHYKDSGDVINQRNALYQAARYISGPGVLTAPEFENTVQKTSGLIESAISKVRKGLSGEISEGEWAAMEKFVANANATLRERAKKAVKNYDERYKGSYYDRKVPGETGNRRKALMGRFGLTDEDFAPPPGAAGPAAPRAALTPQQQKLVDWAKSHPGDKRSAGILRQYGGGR